RERKPAVHALQRLLEAPVVEAREEHCRVRRTGTVGRRHLLEQLALVVDLTVAGDGEPARWGDHRLLAGGRPIDDGQAAMAEGDAAPGVVQMPKSSGPRWTSLR